MQIELFLGLFLKWLKNRLDRFDINRVMAVLQNSL